MSQIAHEYVRLVLAMGHHDPDYVDAYYGPADIKTGTDTAKLTLDDIGRTVNIVTDWVRGVPADGRDELSRLRHQYLEKQLSAMGARVRMLKGERLSFDEESKALYDAVSPTYPDSHFQEVLDRLDTRFPGSGTLLERYDAWRRRVRDPERESGPGLQGRRRRLPRADARSTSRCRRTNRSRSST